MADDGHADELAAGTRVVLREAIYGYEAGTHCIVVRPARETVQVRFETTGHTMRVPRQFLEQP